MLQTRVDQDLIRDQAVPTEARYHDNELLDQHDLESLHGPHAPHDDQNQARRARIETLPPELLLYMSRFLDLAGLLVLSTATCRSLRTIFSQFDRELLFLEPAHRLNLAEWREAARQIDSYLLTRSRRSDEGLSGSVVGLAGAKASSKEMANLCQTMHELTRDESLIDLDLFQAVLAFLAGDASSHETQPDRYPPRPDGVGTKTGVSQSAGVHHIRCLHLTGWHGMAGAFLIQQLRLQPSLRNVCTVVKTERADTRIWEQAAADDQKMRCRKLGADGAWAARARSGGTISFARPGSVDDDWQKNLPSTFAFEKCSSTQIIVQVGKRRPRRQGQPYLRGEGLQMGYQGYCIDMMTGPDEAESAGNAPTKTRIVRATPQGCSGTESRLERTEISGGAASPSGKEFQEKSSGSDGEAHRQDATRKRLHVILQGREEIGAEAEYRKENEEMFERSIVTCNHCKERIKF